MKVEVVRSNRRQRTVQARQVDGTLVVRIPAHMTFEEEQRCVAQMLARFERRQQASKTDLVSRATFLARQYHLPQPTNIYWVDNQISRWASCNPSSGRVRISNRLVGVPNWVLDYVIIHELAHLLRSGHDKRFWDIVSRYQLAERAKGYLMALGASASLEDSEEGEPTS